MDNSHSIPIKGVLNKLSIRDLDIKDKRVFVRVDFNVPLDENLNITDDRRIRSALPTINYAIDEGAKIILASHLGRPKGKPDKRYSLISVARRLQRLIKKEVKFLPDCIGPETEAAASKMSAGDILLIENLRFHPEEEKNDEEFSKKLASLADYYVNDAFGAAHSIKNLEKKVDKVIVGGGMAFTFLKAMGYNVGDSLVENEMLDLANEIIKSVTSKGIKFYLPVDCVIAQSIEPGAETKLVTAQEIPNGWKAVDIGPASVKLFSEALESAKTILWNGPMGVFEVDAFSRGTFAIAHAVADAYALTIVGGGDTDLAVSRAGVAESISFISTGGGAALELLEGRELPGLMALTDK
ncbi:MAG: phosphoglycerate kinase [Nitrospirae bacterium]|nr:phosphoglycerate kinase [Nitrospirota bacterium]